MLSELPPSDVAFGAARIMEAMLWFASECDVAAVMIVRQGFRAGRRDFPAAVLEGVKKRPKPGSAWRFPSA